MLEIFYNMASRVIEDNKLLFMAFAICLPFVAAFVIAKHLRKVKQDVQRRVMADPGTFAATRLGTSARIAKRAADVMDNMIKASGASDLENKTAKALRGKLVQAGYYDKKAVMVFFGLRFAGAFGLGLFGAAVAMYFMGGDSIEKVAFVGLASGFLGYFLPVVLLDRRIEREQNEYRRGFPDFMDLMVVCAQAGLSMEAGIVKIAGELEAAYPALARNLQFTTIEMRSGKTLSNAIDALGRRLGIEEARSFATLLAQSEELGSSLSQSLRAYSDDMRNKRLMKAEEKAFSLPAKLVVPLTLFVFPTLLVVLLLPVVVSVSKINM